MPKKLRSKRSRASDIKPTTAKVVKLRDRACILCGSGYHIELHHHISRGRGGMGVKENVVCLCKQCHMDLHSSTRSGQYRKGVENYLKLKYPNWKKENVIYNKKVCYNKKRRTV